MTSHLTNPIGVFVSGIGGRTVAKTIAQHLPNESIVYFGDTAHTPWGDKSVSVIQNYAIKICDILLQHQCKVIVIACHTASTTAYKKVLEYVEAKARIPVINVVDPVINHIGTHHARKKIGLIGTKQTIRSNVYKHKIDTLNQDIELAALATPLLVPLIEEGFSEKDIAKMAIQEYLSHPTLQDIEALILGCTHYPLLEHYIRHFYQNKIDVIDASEITAKVLKEYLTVNNLLNLTDNVKRSFYVSDYNEFFAKVANLFFPGNIHIEPYSIEE